MNPVNTGSWHTDDLAWPCVNSVSSRKSKQIWLSGDVTHISKIGERVVLKVNPFQRILQFQLLMEECL